MYIPISKVCSILGVSLSTVHRMLKQGILKESFEEQLTQDVIELMTVFCAKLYGKRSHHNKLKPVICNSNCTSK